MAAMGRVQCAFMPAMGNKWCILRKGLGRCPSIAALVDEQCLFMGAVHSFTIYGKNTGLIHSFEEDGALSGHGRDWERAMRIHERNRQITVSIDVLEEMVAVHT